MKAIVDPADLKVHSALSLNIFQIISEAIANAVRHGKANSVRIEIEGSADSVGICICDDGVGMPINSGGALAVDPRSIRRRVTDLEGTLDLRSMPGRTQWSIRIPINECR